MTLHTPALHLQPFALYNEIDDYAASWLERLIQAGHIAKGIVDRRSIEDLRGDDLRGFRQVHFFAGIGVWSYALRRAGVEDDVAVWTGSCPCQPFSAAGKGGGMDDERHLWPAFLHHIREFRPERVLGEQVASKDGLGWLDLVSIDLEAEGYAVGALDTCSAGSGAPHIRQRLRFYAYDLRSAAGAGSYRVEYPAGDGRLERWSEPGGRSLAGGCGTGWLADESSFRWVGRRSSEESVEPRSVERLERLRDATGWMANDELPGATRHRQDCGTGSPKEGLRGRSSDSGQSGWLAYCDGDEQRHGGDAGGALREGLRSELGGRGAVGHLGDAGCSASERHPGTLLGAQAGEYGARVAVDGRMSIGPEYAGASVGFGQPGPTNGFWRDADWLFCRDGKWRPVESESFPLVDGSAFRVGSGSAFEGKSRTGMLKAYGNAVDAEATTDFIEACRASADDLAARRVIEDMELLV